jgi:hypothetical protein
MRRCKIRTNPNRCKVTTKVKIKPGAGLGKVMDNVTSTWILSTGFWDDSAPWVDTETWID